MTRSVSCGAPGSRCSITRRTLTSSSMRLVCVCSRPAVSTTTTSRPRACAASIASNATAAGSPPFWEPTMSACARSAQISSCSSAAARKVSAAARTTECPCSRSLFASLPIVVVLPVPLTPTTRMTLGPSSTASRAAPSRSSSAVASSTSASDRLSSASRASSLCTSSAVAGTPTSAAMSASSRRSHASSSAGSKPSSASCSVSARRLLPSESRSRPRKLVRSSSAC